MPLPKECHPRNVMITIQKGHRVLTVYEKRLPNVGCHYAGVSYRGSSIQHCIARPFENVDEAMRIHGRLARCKHPNILQPLGLWLCEENLKWCKNENKQEHIVQEKLSLDLWLRENRLKWCMSGKKEQDIVEGKQKEQNAHPRDDRENGMDKEKIFRAFITFPLIDGALKDVPRENIFLVQKDGTQSTAFGFTPQGSEIFCDIFGAVEYINRLYEEVANSPSSASSSASPASRVPFSLCSLKLNSGRILYNKLAEGEYQVLIWVDFFTEEQEKKKYKRAREPKVDDIWSANWSTIETYLTSLWESFKVMPNEELKLLAITLSKKLPNGAENRRYTELLWQPGLWTVYIKINFIRDVYWYFDQTKAREDILKSKDSLGLSAVITKLGFDLPDNNLYDSIMFLRKKVVAHQDSSYEAYKGDKDDVGIDKTTIEIFIQKTNSNYMIQMVEEIRKLNWMQSSPLTRMNVPNNREDLLGPWLGNDKNKMGKRVSCGCICTCGDGKVVRRGAQELRKMASDFQTSSLEI
ncbi:hypothetical protein ACP70R_002675 [Stipagrostis hirtigluma subsp. patula]